MGEFLRSVRGNRGIGVSLANQVRWSASWLVPVRMSSLYGHYHNDVPTSVKHSTWWQWRGRIFRLRTETFSLDAFAR